MARKDKETSFETLYTELETTIERLEEGNLSLDQSVALYERGIELAKQCSALLDRAELRIKELTPNAAELVEDDDDPFSLDDDDDE